MMSGMPTSSRSSLDPEKSKPPIPGDAAGRGDGDGDHVTPAATPAHQFPEGGARAWITVVGAWCIMFCTFGYLNAFGVYEAYYTEGPLRDHSPSDIAWIGSIQFFCLFSAGLLSGPIMDRFGPRVVIIPCSLLTALSALLTSLCTSYYQFMLCQGVLGGLAMGFVYSPSIAAVGHYFHRRRPLMMGIIASGSALAGIIFPIVLDALLNHTSLGFGWSQRIVGFIILFFCLVACVCIRPGVEPRRGKYLLLGAFKNPIYSLQVAGMFFTFLGLLLPFYYLPIYAQEHGMSDSLSFHLVAIFNAGSFIGRLAGGGLGQVLGQFNMLSFSAATCGVLIFCWLRIMSNAGLIVYAVLYGFFSGAVIGTMISTIPHLAPHPSMIGTYIGMMSGIVSFSALIGPPVTGEMVKHYGGYLQATVFSGTVALFGSGLIFAARWKYGGRKVVV